MQKLKDWITTDIITSIKNREKLYTNLRSRPFEIRFKQYYNLYRNILNKLVRLSKQLYYQNRLQHAQYNTKLVWNIINKVIGKPNQIVNRINKIRK
jgi:hypothetical protein